MKDHQYIRIDFNERLYKLGITILPEPKEPLVGFKDYPVGNGTVPMIVGKSEEGYFVIAETVGRCVSRILNAINNHVKEWVSELDK